jgi:putative ATPase
MVKLYRKIRDYYKSQDKEFSIEKQTIKTAIMRSDGDARKFIIVMETLIEIMLNNGQISADDLDLVMPGKHLFFDANGSERYDIAHAYQTAIQHSDADAAIYYLAVWVESGEDPAYICRRMLITAFEDCAGNPLAASMAMAASYTTERTGLPECVIPMALATCEMAKSKRNKSAYFAIQAALNDVRNGETVHVPPQLRAGTPGYYAAIKKVYLHDWERDASALSTDEK